MSETGYEPHEEAVRRALRAAAEEVRPVSWPSRSIVERAGRIRRRRRLAVALPAVAAFLGFAVATNVDTDISGGVAHGGPAPTASRMPDGGNSDLSYPSGPGTIFDLGHGQTLDVEHDHIAFTSSGGTRHVVPVAPADSPRVIKVPTATGTMYYPLVMGYSGEEEVAMKMTIGGKHPTVWVITVNQHDFYSVGHVWVPDAHGHAGPPSVLPGSAYGLTSSQPHQPNGSAPPAG